MVNKITEQNVKINVLIRQMVTDGLLNKLHDNRQQKIVNIDKMSI